MLFLLLMLGAYLAHRDMEQWKINIENDLYERSSS